ncbi:MAG: hypothetical protein U9Q81_03385, partial [Pseudomonadota bacterium]|nr:hypothetical protein [Pseudomonadota bacterium]
MKVEKLGVGLNYQPQLLDFLKTCSDELDFLEVVPDIFWLDNGPDARPRYVDDTAALEFLHSMRQHMPVVIPLPTTLPDAALSLEREHEIGDALQTDPERFRAREAIVFPV